MMIPIDYNKMQKELDRRRYMGQVYTGKYETWQATELGIKTYSCLLYTSPSPRD